MDRYFAISVGALLAASLVASLAPAWRASRRVDQSILLNNLEFAGTFTPVTMSS